MSGVKGYAVVAAAMLSFLSPVRADDGLANVYFQGLYDLLEINFDQKDWEGLQKMQAAGYRSIDIDGNVLTGIEEFSLATSAVGTQFNGKLTVRSVTQVGKLVFVEEEVESAINYTNTPTGNHLVISRQRSSEYLEAGRTCLLHCPLGGQRV
jgi:hypothetical protein